MLTVTARVRPGSAWIFSNEIIDPPVAALPAGASVEVRDPKGRYVGRGYANPHSLISIRLLTRGPEDIDSPDFYRERIAAALALRQRVVPGRDAYRVVAGEADGLPGLTLDRYGDIVVAQITTLGMEQRLSLLEPAIRDVLTPAGVMLRNDVSLRALEGLPIESRVWFGEVPARVWFTEGGVRFGIDVVEGQKTGFFLDQAENRAWLAARANGATVLDAFAHVGAWALQSLVAGATHAVTIDSSASACETITQNGAANGLSERLTVLKGDAREVMAGLTPRSFDIVCVDPPAFAKTRKTAAPALVGYRKVNATALRLVKQGGLFFTSSCSHHILPERFEEAILEAAHDAGRELVLLRKAGQGPDHPILPAMAETAYLKHLVFGVR